MLLARLRWSFFGLRGRIVGTVIVTTAVSLGVAALVLMPQLEDALRTASRTTLRDEIGGSRADLTALAAIEYSLIPVARNTPKNTPLGREATRASNTLNTALSSLGQRLGASNIGLVIDVDSSGSGTPVAPVQTPGEPVTQTGNYGPIGATDDVRRAYEDGETILSFGNIGSNPVVRAAIPLSLYKPENVDAVLAVRKSIDEIPVAIQRVQHAFELAALVAILLTLGFAIPLAGTLVTRLQRLRQAALQLAIGGNVPEFPADRARDEVGDLSRSFAIMQRRLRQQEEARRRFVSTASHELRTPLASLNGMLELLADDLDADQIDLVDAAALLDRARAQSRRLSRLAADLLDLSRIDAEVNLRSEPIELGELGRAVLAEFELASSGRGVALTLREDSRPAWALADPGSVARILRILLDNGLRVSPRGSEIAVTVQSTPAPALTVSDQGPGVTPEERALIFERFKRGRETGGEAGFGLGLAIGRELAQRMGGSLELVETEEPGATFTLRLRPTEAPSPGHIAPATGA